MLLCFYQAHFGRTVKWPLWAHLFYSVFCGGHASTRRVSHEPWFCQAHCFVQGPLRFLPVPPNPTCGHSHIWGFPRIAPWVGEEGWGRKSEGSHGGVSRGIPKREEGEGFRRVSGQTEVLTKEVLGWGGGYNLILMLVSAAF